MKNIFYFKRISITFIITISLLIFSQSYNFGKYESSKVVEKYSANSLSLNSSSITDTVKNSKKHSGKNQKSKKKKTEDKSVTLPPSKLNICKNGFA